MRRAFRGVVLVSAIVGAVSAWSGRTYAENIGVPAEKTFTLRIPGEPETLDWNKAHTPIETYVLMNLMEGLVSFDKKLKPIPSLAQSWTLSKDGKTYTFKIRPGVKWQDGVPLKAKDFVYSWKRLLSPLTAASYAYLMFDIEGAEFFNKGTIQNFSQVGVKALDDLTLQVKLTRPVAHWIYIPTFWVTFPLREDVVEKHGNSWATPGRMVTLGPYTLSSYDHDSKIVMGVNTQYWGTRGNVEQVVCQIIKDDSTALTLYESGKLDFLTDIATLDLRRMVSRPDIHRYPYLKTGYLGFVVTKHPGSNVKFRRAVAMAIDKSKFSEILHGGQQGATSFVPPPMMGHFAKMGLPFDVAKARQELKASGVDPSVGTKIELLLPNTDKTLTLSQYIQNELRKNLGLNISLEPFDNKTFRAQLDLHAFPIFDASWSADYPDPDNFLSVFLGNAGNNRAAWKNETFDEQVLAARNSRDPSAREKLYLSAQKLLIEDQAVIVPLYYEPNIALVRPRVKGLELNPLNYLLLKNVLLVGK